MGQVNLRINDKLEKEFRRIAVSRFEAKKGFLKLAIEEAIQDWVNKNRGEAKSV